MPETVTIVILAAGESARMGRPKQLLPFRGQSLLGHAAQTALSTPFRPVIVVLGANANQLRPELDGLDVHIAFNPDWQQGMSSSIKVGVETVSSLIPHSSSLLLMLCDQPFVTPQLLNELVSSKHASGKPIVACEYDGNLGVPALFDHSVYAELLQLQGAGGAKQIFACYHNNIARIPFSQGEFNIDTPEDYSHLADLDRHTDGQIS